MSAAFASVFRLNPARSRVQQVWSCLSLTPNFPMHCYLTQSKIPSPCSSKYGLTWYAPFLLLELHFLWPFVPILSIPGTQGSLLYLDHYTAGPLSENALPWHHFASRSLSVPLGLYSNATETIRPSYLRVQPPSPMNCVLLSTYQFVTCCRSSNNSRFVLSNWDGSSTTRKMDRRVTPREQN